MTTWQAVREHLGAQYTLDLDEGDEIAFTLHRTTKGESRAQRVMLSRYLAFDTEMLECRSAFGEAAAFDPAELLAESLRLPIGGIATHGDYVVLIHKLDLHDTTPGAVQRLAERIGTLADMLEGRAGGDRF